MEVGKTIGREREKPERDSERERVRRKLKKQQAVAILGVLVFLGGLLYLLGRAGAEWYKWISQREEVVEIPREPTIEVIDEQTGKKAEASSRVLEYIAEVEEEFSKLGRKVVLARIPEGKIREVDLELEGVSGVVKVSLDRGAGVSAEDGERMLKYLEKEGVAEFSYVDVRVARKGYWK
ncbi:hypothetical protein IJI72_02460 [Candidatus Saccharibacteria bacterium]|nr:hypothetical protein [Candidatus Saccharibacteria bacterium]